jgi:excisionase family DNA binding protein
MKVKPVCSWDEVPVIMDIPMAARIVGQHPDYIKKRAQKGDFPAFKVGSQWRVEKETLMRFCGVSTGISTISTSEN